jgi:hypothetical protein
MILGTDKKNIGKYCVAFRTLAVFSIVEEALSVAWFDEFTIIP